MAELKNNDVDRVNLVYKTTIGGVEQEVEIPFRLLVCGDFTCDEASEYLDEQEIISISDRSLAPLFSRLRPAVTIRVENRLLNDDSDIEFEYKFTSI